MSVRTRKSVTRRDGEIVLERVRKHFGVTSFDSTGPKLVEHFDWSASLPWAISWEEGPYGWAMSVGMGAVDAPAGLFLEPITEWAVGIHVI